MGTDTGGEMWIQISESKAFDGLEGLRGRKWRISTHMTNSEIVQTMFKAALSYEEHECRESFRYDGELVFGPHMNVDRMAHMLKEHGEAMTDER